MIPILPPWCPECRFRNDGTCEWTPEALMESYFGPGNLTDALASAAAACGNLSGVGRRAECEAAAPVSPDARIVQAAIAFDLQALNAPVMDDECVVWEAGDYF